MTASFSAALEVFRVFLRLGLTSFGGPIAHLGYFHRELVERRRWVSDSQFSQLLAICQFLPGPASSQLGFALGLVRAGPVGDDAPGRELPGLGLRVAKRLLYGDLRVEIAHAAGSSEGRGCHSHRPPAAPT